jgi:hypothetical protein
MLNIILRDKLGNSGTNEFDAHKFIKQDLGKDGDKVLRTAEVFDSSGASHQLSLEFTKQDGRVLEYVRFPAVPLMAQWLMAK